MTPCKSSKPPSKSIRFSVVCGMLKQMAYVASIEDDEVVDNDMHTIAIQMSNIHWPCCFVFKKISARFKSLIVIFKGRQRH